MSRRRASSAIGTGGRRAARPGVPARPAPDGVAGLRGDRDQAVTMACRGPVSCQHRPCRAPSPPLALASLLLPPLAGDGARSSSCPRSRATAITARSVLLLRKLAHVTEYAVLTLCWWRALRGLGVGARRAAARCSAVVGLTLAYAATDEFHQTFVARPPRHAGRRADRLDRHDDRGTARAAVAQASYGEA